MPGFHSFSRFLPHFVLAKLVTSSIRVNIQVPHTIHTCIMARRRLSTGSLLNTNLNDSDVRSLYPYAAGSLIWPIQNDAKKTEKLFKSWHMGPHLRGLSDSYPMNTNMTGFGWFSKIFRYCALDGNSLSIGKV